MATATKQKKSDVATTNGHIVSSITLADGSVLTVEKGWHPDTFSIVLNGQSRYPLFSAKAPKYHVLSAAFRNDDFVALLLRTIAAGNPNGMIAESKRS